MTDSAPTAPITSTPVAPAAHSATVAVEAVSTTALEAAAPSRNTTDDTATTTPRTTRSRRGGRGGRGRSAPSTATETHTTVPASNVATNTAPRRAPRTIPPALEQLAQLYPQLFGAVFLPLKRGIFQDLLAAHPEMFEREALKVALGIHTRSTRYLQSVAAGHQRHDLQGQPVEPMAPEHIHHALLETHRRRQGRSSEDLLPKLRARIVQNIEVSGLSREEYAERVRTRDEAANALLDEAFAELSAKTARNEALLRAFESSGKTVAEFADMYGMDPRTVARTLHSARSGAAAATGTASAQAPDGSSPAADL
ncbi:MAG: ProQ/FINO family protein [Burkholderiaceae bacterium]|nr:ProQ/FINO family protein [Burkholderiaceae bacterium]